MPGTGGLYGAAWRYMGDDKVPVPQLCDLVANLEDVFCGAAILTETIVPCRLL